MMRELKKFSLVGASLLLLCGCAQSEPDTSTNPTDPAKYIFNPIDANGKFSRTFRGTFPIENPSGLLMASDSSGKGPFTAYVACTDNEKMLVSIDKGSEQKNVICDGNKHEIQGIQKIAVTGGVKIELSSSKHSGEWQIQLVGS